MLLMVNIHNNIYNCSSTPSLAVQEISGNFPDSFIFSGLQVQKSGQQCHCSSPGQWYQAPV